MFHLIAFTSQKHWLSHVTAISSDLIALGEYQKKKTIHNDKENDGKRVNL